MKIVWQNFGKVLIRMKLESSQWKGKDIEFTSYEQLKEASFYVIAVPTPIDQHNEPDLTPLLLATRTVASVLDPGDYGL